MLDIIPALPPTDESGKVVPLNKSHIIRRTIDAQEGPRPPPVPTPTPTPVPPGPAPTPAPIPVDGFRLVVFYESSPDAVAKLPQAQQDILMSIELRVWLKDVCVLGPDNKTKEYRFYDKDTDLKGESKLWQDAKAFWKSTADQKVPWLIISNGKTGFSGPLPGTLTEVYTIAKQIKGGN